MFKDGEQQVLDTYKGVLNELENDFTKKDVQQVSVNNDNFYFFTNQNEVETLESSNNTESRGMTRVLTMDNMPKVKQEIEPDKEIEYYYNYNGTSQLDKSAFSNALIIAAVLALIAIVIIVTLSILNYINNF